MSDSQSKKSTVPATNIFAHMIGVLVMNWANNETLFLAMFTSLLYPASGSSIPIWFSTRNTRARMELVWLLARYKINDAALLARIEKAIKHFRKLTTIRNYYCHAGYDFDEASQLTSINSANAKADDEPMAFTTKPATKATLNEIKNACDNLNVLNPELWQIQNDIADITGAPRIERPVLVPASHKSQ